MITLRRAPKHWASSVFADTDADADHAAAAPPPLQHTLGSRRRAADKDRLPRSRPLGELSLTGRLRAIDAWLRGGSAVGPVGDLRSTHSKTVTTPHRRASMERGMNTNPN